MVQDWTVILMALGVLLIPMLVAWLLLTFGNRQASNFDEHQEPLRPMASIAKIDPGEARLGRKGRPIARPWVDKPVQNRPLRSAPSHCPTAPTGS